MTGFAGFELTSESGAKSWLMPTARSSCPRTVAAFVARPVSRPAETAIEFGNSVAGAPIRVTVPPSWSAPTCSGMCAPLETAAFWRPLDSFATWTGSSKLSRLSLLK